MRAAGVAAALVLAACGGDDGGGGGGEDQASEDTEAPAEETTTTTAVPETFRILVSNDDGHEGEGAGLDALVEGLLTLEDVEVTVSIPLADRSATSDSSEPGEQPTSEVTTISGYPATAVDGFPADAVEQGLASMAEPPHLVITGINKGQNLGYYVDSSGTVNAARTGARAGIPALAVSQGDPPDESPLDYPAAVALVLDWVSEHRDELQAAEPVDGTAPVTNLNVPTCTTGELKELLEVRLATQDESLVNMFDVDCTSTAADQSYDIAAFLAGHPVQTELPA